MAWEHEKSGTTVFLDILRPVLIMIGTAYAVLLIWKWSWIAALISAIPVHVVSVNLFSFLILPLYAFTPENRLRAKMFKAAESGDLEKCKALTDEFAKRFNVNIPEESETEESENF